MGMQRIRGMLVKVLMLFYNYELYRKMCALKPVRMKDEDITLPSVYKLCVNNPGS